MKMMKFFLILLVTSFILSVYAGKEKSHESIEIDFSQMDDEDLESYDRKKVEERHARIAKEEKLSQEKNKNELIKEINDYLPNSYNVSNIGEDKVIDLSTKFAHVLRNIVPSDYSDDLANHIIAGALQRGTVDGLLLPMINTIELSSMKGQGYVAGLINPLISELNPNIGDLYQRNFGVPTILRADGINSSQGFGKFVDGIFGKAGGMAGDKKFSELTQIMGQGIPDYNKKLGVAEKDFLSSILQRSSFRNPGELTNQFKMGFGGLKAQSGISAKKTRTHNGFAGFAQGTGIPVFGEQHFNGQNPVRRAITQGNEMVWASQNNQGPLWGELPACAVFVGGSTFSGGMTASSLCGKTYMSSIVGACTILGGIAAGYTAFKESSSCDRFINSLNGSESKAIEDAQNKLNHAEAKSRDAGDKFYQELELIKMKEKKREENNLNKYSLKTQEDTEKAGKERKESERAAKEKTEKAEKERKESERAAKEKAEKERKESEKAEHERIKQEEQERLKALKEAADAAREEAKQAREYLQTLKDSSSDTVKDSSSDKEGNRKEKDKKDKTMIPDDIYCGPSNESYVDQPYYHFDNNFSSGNSNMGFSDWCGGNIGWK